MDYNKFYIKGERYRDAASRGYTFYTTKDGLCEYRNKRDAVRNAKHCGAVNVFSPSGLVVWSKNWDNVGG